MLLQFNANVHGCGIKSGISGINQAVVHGRNKSAGLPVGVGQAALLRCTAVELRAAVGRVDGFNLQVPEASHVHLLQKRRVGLDCFSAAQLPLAQLHRLLVPMPCHAQRSLLPMCLLCQPCKPCPVAPVQVAPCRPCSSWGGWTGARCPPRFDPGTGRSRSPHPRAAAPSASGSNTQGVRRAEKGCMSL